MTSNTAPQTRVSVIVPTYRTGEPFSNVVESLDAQSMPAGEYEVIVIDDGSGDDTVDMVRAVAATRPHWRVEEIENTGWPSKPRNIGVSLARGTYVTFLDHDDRLYPNALLSAADLADRTNADVVNAREVRTSAWQAASQQFTRDHDGPLFDGPRGIAPFTPHKLYRRDFLNEHEIRFREGPKIFWEDYYFNVAAYGAGAKIVTLASEPFYLWIQRPGENTSASYGRDIPRYARNLASLLDYAGSGVVNEADRDWLLRYEYGMRVLGWLVGPKLASRSVEDQAVSISLAREMTERYVPQHLDAQLNVRDQTRSALLRGGHDEALVALAALESSAAFTPQPAQLAWHEGILKINFSGQWHSTTGLGLAQRIDTETEQRYVRALPESASAHVPGQLTDMGTALNAVGGMVIKSRNTNVGWALSADSSTQAVADAEATTANATTAQLTTSADLDVATAALGARLGRGRWLVGGSANWTSSLWRGPLVPSDPAPTGLVDSRVVTVVGTNRLELFVGPLRRASLRGIQVVLGASRVRRGLRKMELDLQLSGFHVHGSGEVPCQVQLGTGDPQPARLVWSNGTARLQGTVPPRRGTHPVNVTGPKWASPYPLDVAVQVPTLGQPVLVAHSPE